MQNQNSENSQKATLFVELEVCKGPEVQAFVMLKEMLESFGCTLEQLFKEDISYTYEGEPNFEEQTIIKIKCNYRDEMVACGMIYKLLYLLEDTATVEDKSIANNALVLTFNNGSLTERYFLDLRFGMVTMESHTNERSDSDFDRLAHYAAEQGFKTRQEANLAAAA